MLVRKGLPAAITLAMSALLADLPAAADDAAPPPPDAPRPPETAPPPPETAKLPPPAAPPPPQAVLLPARTPAQGYAYGPEIPYTEFTPIPKGYHLERKVRWPFVGGGLALFGLAYLGGLIPASLSAANCHACPNNYRPLFAPFVGPLVTIWTIHPKDPTNAWSLLIADTILQVAGVGWALYGVINRKNVLVPDKPTLQVLPIIAPGPVAGATLHVAL